MIRVARRLMAMESTRSSVSERGIRWLLATGFCFLIGASLVFPPQLDNWRMPGQVSLAQGAGDGFQFEFEKAQDLLKHRKFDEALKGFKRANDLRGKTSAESYYGMAQAYLGLLAYKNVIESCDKVVELGGA